MAINKSYTFTNNTIIDPSEVNQNFDDLVAAIRAAHHRDADGTKISYQDIATGWGLIPSGGIIEWSGVIADIPTGYVFCNGSNGTPDLRNLFTICPGQDSGGTYDTGDTGGEATHVLTTAEMPVHNHGVTDPGHYHSVGLSTNGDQDGSGSNGSTYGSGMNTGTAYTGISIQNAGSGAAHNNMPPFRAVVKMMKT